jgi:hypothetical protein
MAGLKKTSAPEERYVVSRKTPHPLAPSPEGEGELDSPGRLHSTNIPLLRSGCFVDSTLTQMQSVISWHVTRDTNTMLSGICNSARKTGQNFNHWIICNYPKLPFYITFYTFLRLRGKANLDNYEVAVTKKWSIHSCWARMFLLSRKSC